MSFKSERFLVEAVEECNRLKIISYVKHGHNIHVINDHGQNLLIHLLKRENLKNVNYEKHRFQTFRHLIENYNLDIHKIDSFGKNVFNWATHLNRTEEAFYLIRSHPGDIDLLLRDNSGMCSLHYAIEHGNELLVQAIVSYLLQYRMRFDIKDKHNNTPEELARKLGFENIAEFLYETNQSTIHMCREIPPVQPQPTTHKSAAMSTKSSIVTLLSLTTLAAPSSNAMNLHDLVESKIAAAKNIDDWKTVAALRKYRTNSNTNLTNSQKPRTNIRQNKKPDLFSDSLKLPQIRNLESSSLSSTITGTSTTSTNSQSLHMLQLIEPQLSASYRKSFVPIYSRPTNPFIGMSPLSSMGNKLPQLSSRRQSSVASFRKRESNVSQLGLLSIQELQNRISLPQPYRPLKGSILLES